MAYDAIINNIQLPRRYFKDDDGTIRRAVPKARMSKKERRAINATRKASGSDPRIETIRDSVIEEALHGKA